MQSPDGAIRVLFDGWLLGYAPGSSGALHLLELVETCAEGVEPWVALPAGSKPVALPENIRIVEDRTPDSPAGRLSWEQKVLPSLAHRSGAQILHLTGSSAPVASPVPVILSPVSAWNLPLRPAYGSRPGLFDRLREALGRGGLANVQALVWPDDLPDPEVHLPVFRLSPLVHPAFFLPKNTGSLSSTDGPLPDPYVLCPGPLDSESLEWLADTWSWVASGLGDTWSLGVSNLAPEQAEWLRQVFAEKGQPLSLVTLCLHSPDEWAAAFQQATVVLNLAPVRPWADTFLYAIACARPLVGWETEEANRRVGPAGYLTPLGDTRALGAALVTLLVEEPVAEGLSQAAKERSEAWQGEHSGYRDTYRALLKQL